LVSCLTVPPSIKAKFAEMEMNNEGQQKQMQSPENQWKKKNETHVSQGRMGTTLQISKDQIYVVNIIISETLNSRAAWIPTKEKIA